ncbi:MAG: glycosyltransferase family 2 protein, partial [Deltaproteobacteria bacterium]|nr:glycosyltransferase family 2 protein [Deltaproteobacteria bacterium]
MWQGARIAVVVPARNEAPRIGRVLRGLPDWVDVVVVVDDGSSDATAEVATEAGGSRTVVVRHTESRGVGAAIVAGYRRALAAGADVLAVMAGDDQMDPRDLPAVVGPVAEGRADYVKGNRFLHPARRAMPLGRRVAGRLLGRLTAVTTGLSIDDSQCGYTALGAATARALPLGELWPRYGYPNDLLGLLAEAEARVVETPVRPVYDGAPSGIRPWH